MEEPPNIWDEYIQKVLSAYRQTPGTAGLFASRTASWRPNCSSAACPWLRSKTRWFWPRRAGSSVLPDLRRWARFVPWHTSRQSSKKCWSCASNQSTSSICAIGSNASAKPAADSPRETRCRTPTRHACGVDDPRLPLLILFPALATSNQRYWGISAKRRSISGHTELGRVGTDEDHSTMANRSNLNKM